MALATALTVGEPSPSHAESAPLPNIVIIYADDLGYGDLSCYGATEIQTPVIDELAREGRRFTRAYATSATCTPSRYGLLTGEYPWRRDASILEGDAPLLIDPGRRTMPAMLREAGYRTAVIGKWHLGLGRGNVDWNGAIRPGPLEIGFDESFLIPATGDRVPSVYLEGHHVVNLDPADPLKVSYSEKVGDEPTGRENPELLTTMYSHGHDGTIVNGISRIGFMAGGHTARWDDETMADTLAERAIRFMEENRDGPFFLFFSLHDPHVPRVPHPRFRGKSGMGPRGDVILQIDWTVGRIEAALERLGLKEDTLVVFSSDNGPVLNDGYKDHAAELLGDHEPAGPLRGAKYSAFEAGAAVPFIVRWPGYVRPGTSDALLSQVDLMASLAALTRTETDPVTSPDSRNMLPVLLGKTDAGREHLVTDSVTLALVTPEWKYIEPSEGPPVNPKTKIELGRLSQPQLYHLTTDPGERVNLAARYPEKVEQLAQNLNRIKEKTQ